MRIVERTNVLSPRCGRCCDAVVGSLLWSSSSSSSSSSSPSSSSLVVSRRLPSAVVVVVAPNPHEKSQTTTDHRPSYHTSKEARTNYNKIRRACTYRRGDWYNELKLVCGFGLLLFSFLVLQPPISGGGTRHIHPSAPHSLAHTYCCCCYYCAGENPTAD